jgi:hypothetical protein
MVQRNPARYLAPVALVATIAGGYMIVHHNASPHRSPAVAGHRRLHRPNRKFAAEKFYVVQSGDILSKIAQKTGVPVGVLESLNPNVSPNSLQVRQKLRLRQ